MHQVDVAIDSITLPFFASLKLSSFASTRLWNLITLNRSQILYLKWQITVVTVQVVVVCVCVCVCACVLCMCLLCMSVCVVSCLTHKSLEALPYLVVVGTKYDLRSTRQSSYEEIRDY